MDKHRKEQLEKRRKKLQEELKLKEIRDRLSAEISFLEEAGFEYKIHYKNEFLKWIYSSVKNRRKEGYRGSHGDFQIDVQDLDAQETIFMRKEELGTKVFSYEILSHISEKTKMVQCRMGGDPDLEFPLEAFLQSPYKFFSFETWFISIDKNWLIEYIDDQEVIRLIQLSKTGPVLIKRIVLKNEVLRNNNDQ